MKHLKRFLLIVLAFIVLAAAGFVAWAETPLGPSPEALAALESDAQVKVTANDWITFQPANPSPTIGFIFYPGGRVDYRSYAPVLRKIAAQGYFVVLLKVPLNLALFSPNAALPVFTAYPQIKHWAVGGHSLGGVAAAQFVSTNPGKVEGIAFWASYPADDKLRNVHIKAVSISGSEDGLSTPSKIEASVKLLPGDTVYVQIAGGNHGQFGSYGPQPGDNPATISPEDQWLQIAAATVQMLKSLAP
ncbi:MAG: alpha/beta hydrolase [Anaerolineales bacterium]